MRTSKAARIGGAFTVLVALAAVVWSSIPIGGAGACGTALEEVTSHHTVLVDPTPAERAVDPLRWSGFRSTAVPSPCQHLANIRITVSASALALDGIYVIGVVVTRRRPRSPTSVASVAA